MKYIYHITPLDNFEKILEQSAILCKNKIQEDDYVSIAYEGIQDKRKNLRVPLPPFGVLYDYVPFYLAPRSPMLCVKEIHQIR